jgi:hypothetical protein
MRVKEFLEQINVFIVDMHYVVLSKVALHDYFLYLNFELKRYILRIDFFLWVFDSV